MENVETLKLSLKDGGAAYRVGKPNSSVFYLLDDPSGRARDLAVCRLAHKAFALGHRVFILTGDGAEAGRLDDLLWSFSAGSFVPHELHSESGRETVSPVVIGSLPLAPPR